MSSSEAAEKDLRRKAGVGEVSGFRYQVSALNPRSTQEGTDESIR